MKRASFLLATTAAMLPIICLAASSYAGEQSRSIKSLSDQEAADYLSGKGMGLAKAAELNGYPGPAHVLELADQLALTEQQKAKTEQVFARMQGRARELGAQLVEAERRLDQLFASKTISHETLTRSLNSIAMLQSDIRAAHLQAHLEEAAILSSTQQSQYWELRGYGAANTNLHRKH